MIGKLPRPPINDWNPEGARFVTGRSEKYRAPTTPYQGVWRWDPPGGYTMVLTGEYSMVRIVCDLLNKEIGFSDIDAREALA